MTARLCVLALTLACPLTAQQFGARLGAGPAVAGQFGVAGLVAVQMATGAALFRADGRIVSTSEGAGAQSGSKVLSVGVAAGWTGRRSAPALRPYMLGTAGRGTDLRESDVVTTLGVAAGLDRLLWRVLFVEARYERWIQSGIQYYDLPRNTVSLVLGVGFP